MGKRKRERETGKKRERSGEKEREIGERGRPFPTAYCFSSPSFDSFHFTLNQVKILREGGKKRCLIIDEKNEGTNENVEIIFEGRELEY